MTPTVFSLACLLLVGIVTCDEVKSYRGHYVLSAEASTEEQLAVLRNLENHYDVMFLREPSLVLSTDMVVPPGQKDQISDILRDAGITVTVQSTDLQAEIDAEKSASYMNSHFGNSHPGLYLAHDFYRNLSQVYLAMENFAEFSPGLVKVKYMAYETHEKNLIKYLQVGTPSDSKGNKDKPVIFFEGLIHAREWIAIASLLFTVDEMLNQYSTGNATIQKVLQEFTWIIIPVVNPDGYDYSWTTDRLWRKNRKPHNCKPCTGVDLNRNYDMKFGEVGVSKDCSRETYPGENPFTEEETANVRDLFLLFKPRIVAFLSAHAYSQVLLRPWGHSMSNDNMPPNSDKLIDTGHKMLDALQSTHGQAYTFGTPYQTLGYAASGGSFDWALKEKPGIYSYCFELRPRTWESGGFDLHPNQIIPTGEELLQAMLTLAEVILEERQGA